MENAIFFWYNLNKFNKFNIGTVNAIQKKSDQLQRTGEQIKRLLLFTLLQ